MELPYDKGRKGTEGQTAPLLIGQAEMGNGVRLPEAEQRPEVIGVDAVEGIPIIARIAANITFEHKCYRVVPVERQDNQVDNSSEDCAG